MPREKGIRKAVDVKGRGECVYAADMRQEQQDIRYLVCKLGSERSIMCHVRACRGIACALQAEATQYRVTWYGGNDDGRYLSLSVCVCRQRRRETKERERERQTRARELEPASPVHAFTRLNGKI